MKIKYITEPLEQYVTRHKSAETNYTTTEIHCPLCRTVVSKRGFEDHVFGVHGTRADEAFARLFGLPFPVRCTCGKELHYDRAHKGFPTSCGTCATGCTSQLSYESADDAHKHIEQLEQMLADARAEEKRLKKEAELSRIPLKDLPFPTKKDPRFLKRISMDIRVAAVNGDKQQLLDLAGIIDSLLSNAGL